MDRSSFDYLRSPAPLALMIDADAVPVRHDPVRRPIDIRYPGRVEVAAVPAPGNGGLSILELLRRSDPDVDAKIARARRDLEGLRAFAAKPAQKQVRRVSFDFGFERGQRELQGLLKDWEASLGAEPPDEDDAVIAREMQWVAEQKLKYPGYGGGRR